MIRILTLIACLTFAIPSLADAHYWVAKVTAARTVYEPIAEYQYDIEPLGVLLGDESTYVNTFSIPSVISHSAVLEGNWVLLRVNTETRNVVIIDAQDPMYGFAESKVFYDLFLQRLNKSLATVDQFLLSYGDLRTLRFMIVINGLDGADVLYHEKNKNLLIASIEYYSRYILKDFLPFVRRKDLWSFRVSTYTDSMTVFNDRVKSVQGAPFNKVFDYQQPIPNLALLNEQDKKIQ